MPTCVSRDPPDHVYFLKVPPPYCASSELVSGTSMVTTLPLIAVILRSQFWSLVPGCQGLSRRSMPMSWIQFDGLGRLTRISLPTARPEGELTWNERAATGT